MRGRGRTPINITIVQSYVYRTAEDYRPYGQASSRQLLIKYAIITYFQQKFGLDRAIFSVLRYE